MFNDWQKQRYLQLVEDTDLTKREIARALGISYNTFLLYEAKWGVKNVRRVVDEATGERPQLADTEQAPSPRVPEPPPPLLPRRERRSP